MSPSSSHQVSSALLLTYWQQSSRCFETLGFAHAFGAAKVFSGGTQMDFNDSLGPIAQWRITTVIAAGL